MPFSATPCHEPYQADRKKRRCKQKGVPKANAFGAPFLNGSSATFPVCSSTIEKGYSEKCIFNRLIEPCSGNGEDTYRPNRGMKRVWNNWKMPLKNPVPDYVIFSGKVFFP